MRMHVIVVLVFVTMALGGCATLSESQCAGGDWFGIGRADALGGYTPDRLGQHQEACAKYAVGVDAPAYDAGYGDGLVAFCVPEEGFALGHRGAAYSSQCPDEAARDFVPAFDLGTEVHAIEQDLARIEQDIEALRNEMDDDDTSEDERAGAGRSLDRAKDERDRRQSDRSALLERARTRGYADRW